MVIRTKKAKGGFVAQFELRDHESAWFGPFPSHAEAATQAIQESEKYRTALAQEAD